MTAINDAANARAVLDAVLLTMDGRPGKANTVLRRRRVVGNVVKYAIEVGHLDEDPFKRITWTPPKASKRLDRRRVPNPAQVAELLTAVSYVGSWERGRGRRLAAFFACMYYAMMRPEEVIALRVSDCHLPDKGWGLLTLEKATPTAGKAWTDSGKVHDEKGLKQRPEDEIRPVPIPPVLVAMLKTHISEFAARNGDGRVFGNERGGRIVASTYSRVWREARPFAMTSDRGDSLLAAVLYDLRHAGVSLGLRSTRDPALIAERAGHSVEIMMSTYSWVLDDQDKIANKAIEDALGDDPSV
ncbi:tyrosine-type recombinase/integrase [Catenulispora subtropica]|uniref:Tyr recombinase domain-containing protein n=1 Tax=Catenulispora subtropica TaxID=450798 RepID=A0ABN2R1V5_9ACTN